MDNIISLKEKAISLRSSGKSYREINEILGIPKSTLSTWLKNLPLSKKVKARNINKAKLIWAENIKQFNKLRSKEYKIKELGLIEQFSREIPDFDHNTLFWVGLALFWAEGGKREKWSVRFANSDPLMVKMIMRFFREICLVTNEKFRFQIQLHPNITDRKAKKFWSEIAEVGKDQFYKSQVVISKTSQGKRKQNQLPYGTLHIYIGNSYLNKKIKGWLKGLSEKI